MSVANEPDAAVPQPRSGPLVVRVGEDELILLAEDVDTIVAGAVEALAVLLESSGTRLNDPPVELDRDRARLMRQILADIEGYQRRELSPVLRDLRQLVAADA
jgi:hypothetical protein